QHPQPGISESAAEGRDLSTVELVDAAPHAVASTRICSSFPRSSRGPPGRPRNRLRSSGLRNSIFCTVRRVLVVDDEENLRLVLRTLLRRHGYEVETAKNGEEALALVDGFGPDVVLTDVRMPKMGGLDLLETL